MVDALYIAGFVGLITLTTVFFVCKNINTKITCEICKQKKPMQKIVRILFKKDSYQMMICLDCWNKETSNRLAIQNVK